MSPVRRRVSVVTLPSRMKQTICISRRRRSWTRGADNGAAVCVIGIVATLAKASRMSGFVGVDHLVHSSSSRFRHRLDGISFVAPARAMPGRTQPCMCAGYLRAVWACASPMFSAGAECSAAGEKPSPGIGWREGLTLRRRVIESCRSAVISGRAAGFIRLSIFDVQRFTASGARM